MFQSLLFEALQFNNQNKKPNTINENYLELSEKYNNLQDKYNRFCIKSAVIKPIDLHVEEVIKESNEENTGNIQNTSREERQICTLHGFHDLYSHALDLATQNAEEASKLLSSITMLETFPGFSEVYDPDTIIMEKKNVIDNWNLFPYLSYLQKIKNNMISVSRKHLQDQVTSKYQKTVKTLSYIVFSPNKWFQEFLYVYEKAKHIHKDYYPKYENMENLLYTKNKYYPLTRDANASMMICKNYALDIPYHLSRFAALISKIKFVPYKSLPMMQDTFTDIELLIHYALRKDTQEYSNFLQDPKSFFACTELGSKHTLLLHRLHQAAVEILQSWKSTYKVRNTSRGMELVELISSKDENAYQKINVPDIIVKNLSLDILDNIMVYEREREIPDYTYQVNSNPHIYKESPLGKLLNFDKASRAEFIRYYKLVNPENPLLVSARFHIKVIGGFSCIAKVYSMLMMASLCLYNMSDIENESVHQKFDEVSLAAILGSCIRYNSNLNIIFYASTLEIFPGLLFYTFLGANEKSDNLSNHAKAQRSSNVWYEHESGLSDFSYFEHNKQRTDFFNLFAMYAAQLKPLSDSSQTNTLPTSLYQQSYDSKGISENLGIRWVTHNNLQMLCESVPEIAECRANYCTILAQICRVDEGRRLHSDRDLNQYFLRLLPNKDNKPCTPTVENNYQIATFYKLPVVFLYEYIVAEKPKPSSSLGMLLQNMSGKLQENIDYTDG